MLRKGIYAFLSVSALVALAIVISSMDLSKADKPDQFLVNLPHSHGPHKLDFRNYYGIGNRGKAHDNLLYTRQMGYDYVFYQHGMELDTLSNGMHFYLEDPEFSTYKRIIDRKQRTSQKDIDFIEKNCALKDRSGVFPDNLARGWIWKPDTDRFVIILDYQQQRVIDWAIDTITRYVEGIEARNPKFHFAGYTWDEPRPSGDFYDIHPTFHPVTLATWTGGDYGIVNNGQHHDYDNYTDGHMAFYKKIYKVTRAKYPDAHFMSEPFRIYEGWVKTMKDRKDGKELTPDILSQEGPGTQFIDDQRIFDSGFIKRENVISTTSSISDEPSNRLTAADAAVHGQGFCWFGCFGGAGNMPNYMNVMDVPQRILLTRMLTTWENGNGTPLSDRSWDGEVYQSKTAFVSKDVIAILQPYTKKLFVVFLTADGNLRIPSGRTVKAIFRTDNYFIESQNGNGDVDISNRGVRLRNQNYLGRGYIFNLN